MEKNERASRLAFRQPGRPNVANLTGVAFGISGLNREAAGSDDWLKPVRSFSSVQTRRP